jgi:hypothetical protein
MPGEIATENGAFAAPKKAFKTREQVEISVNSLN